MFVQLYLTLIYPPHFEYMFSVNLESITFMKVKIIVSRHVVYHFTFTNKQYRYTNHMQVILMMLMSTSGYFIVPKGTKFMGLGKLGLNGCPKELGNFAI